MRRPPLACCPACLFAALLAASLAGAHAESKPRLTFSPARPGDGQPLLVFVKGAPRTARIVGEAFGQVLEFEWDRAARAHVALAAVPLHTRAGRHLVDATVTVEGKSQGLTAKVATRWLRYPRAEVRIHEKTPEEEARALRDKAERLKKLGLELPDDKPVGSRKRVRAAYENAAVERYWRLPFHRPLATRVTEAFGVRRKYLKLRKGKVVRRWRGRHMGLDLDGDGGEPIGAIANGAVVVAGHFKNTGRAVWVEHGDELFTAYFHMSRVDVKEGQRVKRGQRLGWVGATGLATGPHLHLQARVNGVTVDPDALLRLLGGPLGPKPPAPNP